MSDQPRKPDFLIIGAAKCATTWLTECLIEHPAVVIPKGEANHFSWHFDEADPLPASYLKLFEQTRDDQVCGENSNTYISHHRGAERIHAVLPGIKLIVSLRNPVDRAYSDWSMRLKQQYRLADQWRFLDPDQAPDLWFLHNGLYHQQLQPFLELFGRERMHFMLMDDVRDRPMETFAEVSRFLGVDDQFQPQVLTQRVNARERGLIMPRLRERLERSPRGERFVKQLKASPLYPVMHRVLARSVKAPPLDEKTRVKLKNFYRDDVRSLARLLGRDLSHWIDS